MSETKFVTMPQAQTAAGLQEGISGKDRHYLDTQRPLAEKYIAGESLRGFFLNDLIRVYVRYFVPGFAVNTRDYEKVAIMLKDLYRRYDEWLATGPALDSLDAKRPLKAISKEILDRERPEAETFIRAHYTRGLDFDGLLTIMQDEFRPGYHVDRSNPDATARMLTELYEMYDARLAEEKK